MRAYCTYLAESDLDAAVERLRAEAVAEVDGRVHRPGDGTAEVVTPQVCRVTEATLLARHLLERAVDEPRPEGPELLALTVAALGRPGSGLPDALGGVDRAIAAIPVCDDAAAYQTEPTRLDVDVDHTDVAALNSLHLHPPSAVRYRLGMGARLDWIVRDASEDEWRVVVDAPSPGEPPGDATYVVHRSDPATGAFTMEPAGSYDDAVRLATEFAERGFPEPGGQGQGFGNPYPEVFTVAVVRFVDGGIDVVAPRLAEARREFVTTPHARYWANVVTGERSEPHRTGWVLFGLTDLPAS